MLEGVNVVLTRIAVMDDNTRYFVVPSKIYLPPDIGTWPGVRNCAVLIKQRVDSTVDGLAGGVLVGRIIVTPFTRALGCCFV